MIHSRVSWMFAPVDRSMMVSAPQMVLHCSFSTSCGAQQYQNHQPHHVHSLMTMLEKYLPQ
jgi:hypothetical protein